MQKIVSYYVHIDMRTGQSFGVVMWGHIHGVATLVIHSCRRRSVGCGVPDNVCARVYMISHSHVGRECVCVHVYSVGDGMHSIAYSAQANND